MLLIIFLKKLPMQHQNKQPGIESLMNPLPIFDDENYIPSNKLKDKSSIDYRRRQWNRKSSFYTICKRRSKNSNFLFR